jgi:hypothetical protein
LRQAKKITWKDKIDQGKSGRRIITKTEMISPNEKHKEKNFGYFAGKPSLQKKNGLESKLAKRA